MARQYDGLWNHLISFENLLKAFQKAARGKRSNPIVADFENNRERYIFTLQHRLANKSYRPAGYRSFRILDPKPRLISAAPFHDRVIHHALCNVIDPIFERTFIGDSYANRKGKGVHKALDKAQKLMRQYPFVLQCDIRQFFPSIDHQRLFLIVRRKIADPNVLWLVRAILKGGEKILRSEYDMVYFPGDDFSALNRPRGLPIGNLTSQLWANVYLNDLDQYVKRQLKCQAFVRYVDDFLLLAEEKKQLWEWKRAVREYLYSLRLVLHEGSSTVYPVTNGIPFLGFRLYPAKRRLKTRNARLFEKRLRRYQRAFRRGEISFQDLNHRVQGWVAHASHGDTKSLRRSILGRAF